MDVDLKHSFISVTDDTRINENVIEGSERLHSDINKIFHYTTENNIIFHR